MSDDLFNSTPPLHELPPLAPQARQYVSSADVPRKQPKRRPGKPGRRRSKRGGVGAFVLGGTAVVVVGALVALYFVGQNRAEKQAANFSSDQLAATFLSESDMPSGWEAGGTAPTQTPQQMMENGYWNWVTIDNDACAPIDFSLGMLVPGQGTEYAGYTTDQILTGASAFSADGLDSLQQLGRTFVDGANAQSFITALSTSLTTCTEYSVVGDDGTSSTQVESISMPSGVTNPGVAFHLTGDAGDLSTVFLMRGNVVVQLMATGTVADAAAVLASTAPMVDARISAMTPGK